MKVGEDVFSHLNLSLARKKTNQEQAERDQDFLQQIVV